MTHTTENKKKAEKYKGYLITKKCGYFWALGMQFKTEKSAKRAIDFLDSEKEFEAEANEMQEKYSLPDDDPVSWRRGYIKAVNERQKLIDSNRELLKALESAWKYISYKENGAGLGEFIHPAQQIATAINNAKNLQS